MTAWAPGLVLAVALAGTALAQVDCDTPDDLCTGDPCVVGSVEVDDSCVLDFGARTLIVLGGIKLPNSGTLSLTAETVQVMGRILNMSSTVAGPGPTVTLAAAGDIALDGPIRVTGVRGAAIPGRVTIQAGGSLAVRSTLNTLTSPSTITWSAGSGNVDFSGRVNTSKPGGEISIAAGGRIDLFGSLRR